MIRGIWLTAFFALCQIGASVNAQEPDLKPGLVSSAETNFEFALTRVCLAYVSEGKDDVLDRKWGVSSVGWGKQEYFKRVGEQAHMIGVNGRINVGVKALPEGRQCDIEVNQGDPVAYRAILLRVAASRPEGFKPSKTPPDPRDYFYRDHLCAGQGSPLLIVASTNSPNSKSVAMYVTVTSMPPRSANCDREPPPSNVVYPAMAPSPNPAREPASLETAQGNLELAIRSVCFPFLFETRAEETLAPAPYIGRDGAVDPLFKQNGVDPWRVGTAGNVHVGVQAQPARRVCTVMVGEGEAGMLRDSAMAMLKARPERFEPAASPIAPRGYASRETLCSRSKSPSYNAVITLSSPPEGGPHLYATLMRTDARPQYCD